MKEIWTTIKDFEDYEVSNLGRIRKMIKGNYKILKPQENKKSHFYQQMLYKKIDGKSNPYLKYVHRLVAEAFLKPNSDERFNQIYHKDGNLQNNVVSNLAWKSGDIALNEDQGIIQTKKGNFIKQRYHYIIKQMLPNGLVVATYRDAWDELREKGFKKEQILRCSQGKYLHDLYKSFKWEVVKIKITKK